MGELLSINDRLKLILFSIVGFNGLCLDDDSRIASSERSAFCGDSSGYITRGQS